MPGLIYPIPQRFEPPSLGLLDSGDFALQISFLRDERVLHLAELGKLKGAVGKGRVKAVNLRLHGVQLGGQPSNLLLPDGGAFGLPCLDLGEKPLGPFVRQHRQRRVAAHFLGKHGVTDEAAAVARLVPVLVRATVIGEGQAALFDVPLAGDGAAACRASGKIEEGKSLFFPPLAGLTNGDAGLLDGVKSRLGNHRDVRPLVHLALVHEHPVVKGVAEHVADGRQGERLAAEAADQARRLHLPLDGGQGVLAGGEAFHDPLHLRKVLRVRLNGACLGVIDIPDGGLAGIDAAPDFLADATADVHREVADILVRHAQLDGDHEHVVGREIALFKRADFLNDAPLKQADDLAAVVKIAGEPVKFP